MPAKFVLTKSRNGQFHFALLATNGRTIAASEMYNTRAAALTGIASIQKNAAGARLEDNTATTPAKKAPTKKVAAKKTPATKTARKAPAKKTAATKTPAKRTAAKTAPAKTIAQPAPPRVSSPPARPAAAARSIAAKAAASVSDAVDAVTDRISGTAPDGAQT